eukprot:TRINITY_DN42395_c0_g1_i1.p1 TRINITY_DN42395_c0_g1~~TRINITY_DN42395_c0_g1_i1.p1  ORF type:complete len:293 (+),score=65.21 TRINITY_DN42395_c0_g1_i1:101-979(+)
MNLILLQLAEVEAADEEGGVLLPKDDRRARHIATVLRPAPGATVRLGVEGGGIGRVPVEVLEDGRVRLALTRASIAADLTPPADSSRPRVDLLLAMPRPKVMTRLWSRLAQLGVRQVFIVNAYRVEKAYFSSHAVKAAEYMAELREGCEQAVCTQLPEVRVEMRLKPFVEDVLDELCPPDKVARLLCHPGDGGLRVLEAVEAAKSSGQDRVLLAVGPEGGWVEYELELFKSRHFVQVALGSRVLSTDMAVVSLIALASDALGGLEDAPVAHTEVRPRAANAGDSGGYKGTQS